jgi:hypothetical protein
VYGIVWPKAASATVTLTVTDDEAAVDASYTVTAAVDAATGMSFAHPLPPPLPPRSMVSPAFCMGGLTGGGRFCRWGGLLKPAPAGGNFTIVAAAAGIANTTAIR